MFKGQIVKHITVVTMALVFAIFAVGTSGCGKSDKASAGPSSAVEKIKAAGKLVVGTSADYPPYEFHLAGEAESEIVGIDVEIANVIAQELGVKIEIRDMVFSQLFDALGNDEVDMVIAGLTPTEERRQLVDFSDVYFHALQNLLIRTTDKETILSVDDLRGKTVGSQTDSIYEDLIKTRISGATFHTREKVLDLVDDLKNQVIDAIILEKPVAEAFVNRHPDVFTNIDCSGDSLSAAAIAVKKGNRELLDSINGILKTLIENNRIEAIVENAKVLVDKY